MTYTDEQAELALGPARPWLRQDLKAQFEVQAGVSLTPAQWERLSRVAKSAGQLFLWESPRTPDSRKRIHRLRLAAIEFHAALRAVIEHQVSGMIDPSAVPAEVDLGIELMAAVEAANEHVLDEDEVLVEAARLTAIIRTAADRTDQDMMVPSRGEGRKTFGYDNFLEGCRRVWIDVMGEESKGFSTRGGRGSGRFVTFVWSAEMLLPMLMRRVEVEKVGDAVVRHFGR